MASNAPWDALLEHGMLLESARGPVPNVAEIVAGEPIKGSWWGHPAGHQIYAVLNEFADSPDVIRFRLLAGRITLVHRRLWPSLVRLSDRFPPDSLTALRQTHTTSGAHRTARVPFPQWVTPEVRAAADQLEDVAAVRQLPGNVLD
jgi:hypothetical protein